MDDIDMQLAGIKISNLFSFPYTPDLHSAQEISFSVAVKNNVHVLIGPNGAGKSKFLDIIKYVLRYGLRKDYVLDHEHLRIMLHQNDLEGVYPHYQSSDRSSEVAIRLMLTAHDYDNLRFLCDHRQDINQMIRIHSDLDVQFPPMEMKKLLEIGNIVNFHCIFDLTQSKVLVVDRDFSPEQRFVLEYLLHNELIQICIDIHNTLSRKEDRKDLYSTFAVLGFQRNTSGLPSSVFPHEWDGFVYERGQYSTRAGYFLCAQKIRQILSPTQDKLPDDEVAQKLNRSDFFVSLTAIIHKYFNKTIRVSFYDNALHFSFVDARGYVSGFDEFSDGEQSLLVIVLTIYGYDLSGGLLIIDEPEIHFHPQMQRSLSRMMEKISNDIGTQFILSTYSPLFINESNINHVYRFAKQHGITEIKSPSFHLSDDESSLVHLLKFENMSKIFFVNKIIMVEGETDAYFFDYYFKYLHSFPKWKDVLTDYEILNINGKGSYKVWKKFLSKFGIRSYFIGDWDNIVDYGLVSHMDLVHYHKKAKSYFPRVVKSLGRGSHYDKLVITIKDLFPAIYQKLLASIRKLYDSQVYILEKGDIETYINLKEKGLEATVAFCRHEFNKRTESKHYQPYREELNDIIGHIFLP